MNEFYSIAEADIQPENEFQLSNIGPKKVLFSGGRTRTDGFGGKIHTNNTVYGDTKPEDYDNSFAHKISRMNPPYDLDKLIYHHFYYYKRNGGNGDKFIKHIEYVILPLLEKYYVKQPAHIELTKQWISEVRKYKNVMIEYSELTDVEKDAINKLIQSAPPHSLSASYVRFNKSEIDDILTNNKEYHLPRIMNFLETNEFIKLFAYDGTYEFIVEGRKLLKYGSIEKYYEKITNQTNQSNPQVTGNGNIVNVVTNGGSITQSGITITINQNQYSDLKEWGVDNEKIKELEAIVSTPKDKATIKEHLSKWLSAVTVSLITKGATAGIPKVMDFIHQLM